MSVLDALPLSWDTDRRRIDISSWSFAGQSEGLGVTQYTAPPNGYLKDAWTADASLPKLVCLERPSSALTGIEGSSPGSLPRPTQKPPCSC